MRGKSERLSNLASSKFKRFCDKLGGECGACLLEKFDCKLSKHIASTYHAEHLLTTRWSSAADQFGSLKALCVLSLGITIQDAACLQQKQGNLKLVLVLAYQIPFPTMQKQGCTIHLASHMCPNNRDKWPHGAL